jgi:hypothetical protein
MDCALELSTKLVKCQTQNRKYDQQTPYFGMSFLSDGFGSGQTEEGGLRYSISDKKKLPSCFVQAVMHPQWEIRRRSISFVTFDGEKFWVGPSGHGLLHAKILDEV